MFFYIPFVSDDIVLSLEKWREISFKRSRLNFSQSFSSQPKILLPRATLFFLSARTNSVSRTYAYKKENNNAKWYKFMTYSTARELDVFLLEE